MKNLKQNDLESLDKILLKIQNKKIAKLVKKLNEKNFKCFGTLKLIQKQKNLFKGHWKNVNYINCGKQKINV